MVYKNVHIIPDNIIFRVCNTTVIWIAISNLFIVCLISNRVINFIAIITDRFPWMDGIEIEIIEIVFDLYVENNKCSARSLVVKILFDRVHILVRVIPVFILTCFCCLSRLSVVFSILTFQIRLFGFLALNDNGVCIENCTFW